MTDTRYPLGTKEYLKIPLETFPAGVTSMPVKMSAVTQEQFHATDSDWLDAEWTPGATTPTARILFGPGTALPLGLGTYILRARVTATPEIPIVEAGGLVEIH